MQSNIPIANTNQTKYLNTSNSNRKRIHFLDGLRGLMALYVVLFHACYFARDLELNVIGTIVIFLLKDGHFAVDVFIVLSGFSLMIPLAKTNSNSLRYGFGHYIKRRARRILPPYYVALICSIGLLLIGQYMQSAFGFGGKSFDEALSPGSLLSHFLLIHNLNWDWVYRINGPLWSVATEWQIYFLFPLLLLPIIKRFGHIPLIIIATLIGLSPIFIFPPENNFWWAFPWFLGLFAMGMVCAVITLSPKPFAQQWHRYLAAWPTFTIIFALIFLSVFPDTVPIWVMDILVGIGTMSLISFCMRVYLPQVDNKPEPIVYRILNSRVAVKLGLFSYSLYLIHGPIQNSALILFQSTFNSPELLMLMMVSFTLIIILPLAFIFYLFFERPFINNPNKKQKPAIHTS